jgi:hypothetical protein
MRGWGNERRMSRARRREGLGCFGVEGIRKRESAVEKKWCLRGLGDSVVKLRELTFSGRKMSRSRRRKEREMREDLESLVSYVIRKR